LVVVYAASLCFAWFYSVKAQRRLDAHFLALVACTAYFAPLLVGRDLTGDALHPGVYVVGTAVVLALTLSAAIRDTHPVRASGPHTPLSRLHDNYARVLALLTFGIGMVVFWQSDFMLFTKHKNLIEVWGWLLPVWRVSGTLLFLFGVVTKRRPYLAIGALHLLAVFLSNDRTNIAMVGGALLLLYGANGVRMRTLLRPKLLAIFSILIAAVVWGSTIFAAAQIWERTGDLNQATGHIRTADYAGQLLSAEPFGTQLILNRVLHTGYELPAGYLLGAMLQWVPSVSWVGLDSGHFNRAVQSDLFPDATYGMAYNFWAEGISTGGALMFGLFVALFILWLNIIDTIMARTRSPLMLSVVAYMAAFWTIYIHRNSMLTSLAYQRQILYFALGAVLLSFVATKGKRAMLQRVLSQRIQGQLPADLPPNRTPAGV
jgi:hypothetical protein